MNSEQQGQIVIVPPQVDHAEYVSRMKRSRFARTLVYIEVISSSLVLLIGIVTLVISHSSIGSIEYERRINSTSTERVKDVFYFGTIHLASAAWGGVIMVASSIVGLYSIRHPERKGPRLAFLILVIFASVASFLTFVAHSLRAHGLNYRWLLFYYKDTKILSSVDSFYVLKTLLGIIAFVAFVNFVCCICSASLWCYHWCNCLNDNSSVLQSGQMLYVKNDDHGTQSAGALKPSLDSSGNMVLKIGDPPEVKPVTAGQKDRDDNSEIDGVRKDFRYGKLED